jgi:hypothetical protein
MAWINLLEHKLNSDLTKFFYSFFVVEIQRPNPMAGCRRQSAGGEFVLLRRQQYLPHVAQN